MATGCAFVGVSGDKRRAITPANTYYCYSVAHIITGRTNYMTTVKAWAGQTVSATTGITFFLLLGF